jgi:hypothetical protein
MKISQTKRDIGTIDHYVTANCPFKYLVKLSHKRPIKSTNYTKKVGIFRDHCTAWICKYIDLANSHSPICFLT